MEDLGNLEKRMHCFRETAKHFIQDRPIVRYNIYFQKLFKEPLIGYILKTGKIKGEFCWADACCGFGVAMRNMANYCINFKLEMFGIDCMRETNPVLDENIKKYGEANYKWARADIKDVKLDRKADLISCIGGINYVSKKKGYTKNKLKVISHLFSQLNPGGIFFFSDHGRYDAETLADGLDGVLDCRVFTKSGIFEGKKSFLTAVGLVKA